MPDAPTLEDDENLCLPCRQPELDVPPACPLQCCCRSCVAFPFKPAKINTEKSPIIWVLGGPGSGKGTQCDKIICKYGFTHLSTGDLLRDEVKSGSHRAGMLADIMAEGKLVPNDVVLDLLVEAMTQQAAEAKGFLIDGYPRERSQGEAFEKKIAPVTTILYFEADVATLTKRLLSRGKASGRVDDNEETIRKRLQTFNDNNELILKQYSDKLKRIDAMRHIDDVFEDVVAVIDPLVANTTLLK